MQTDKFEYYKSILLRWFSIFYLNQLESGYNSNDPIVNEFQFKYFENTPNLRADADTHI